ncbi:MAG: hypothetical protein DWI03_10470 [Planctomycetota bacterium]|nr:MAG: hypothetical protein DWI03_10470 [Planctomycetota bacterium]
MASPLVRLAFTIALAFAAHAPSATAAASRPATIRVQWGGGTPHAWTGTVAVVAADAAADTPVACEWRTLCTEPDAAAMAHEAEGTIVVHQVRPLSTDGVEIVVPDWQRCRVVARLSAGDGQPVTVIDVPVAGVLGEPAQKPLDSIGNRLTLKPAPGDSLRVTVEPAANVHAATQTAVLRPGERLRLRVDPLLAARVDGGGSMELRLRLKPAQQSRELDAQATTLVPIAAAAGAGGPGDRRPTPFEPVVFEVVLPGEEGVYEVELEAMERGSLRWARPLASRTVQLVAVADAAVDAAQDVEWKTVYELDPGSPRLHERLRRLPGVGLPAVSLPSVPLPSMPLPSLTRPTVPLPKLPNVNLPNVPLPSVHLPNVSAMVPRLSGLLASGDSVLTVHAAGPLLRLPPARTVRAPSWEGIVLAVAQPGIPHAVEIEFPLDQDAVLGVSVLEADAAGTAVESRHSGGFEVRADAGQSRVGVHRFVFWPATKHPLIVISNPSPLAPALFGRVRVAAGPARLPAPGPRPDRGHLAAAAGASRPIHAFLPSPDLHREFGGVGRVAAAGGRPGIDWGAHLAAARHSADSLRSQGLAGAMVTVYTQGAALWPSACTQGAPRWDATSTADAGWDPLPKDVLELLARVYGREGLSLVPALSFDAPLPAVEALLNGPAAPGIACVGREGRPRRVASGGVHYNVLDPRVQAAVEATVVEMATRLRGAPAVTGVALLLPHDGWLHLPGLAWGLDDATFARFVAATGGEDTGGADRHAARARLVEGPLREPWLAWRSAELARFYARLADAIGDIDDRWSVYVTPTTLFAAGDFAVRFRPALGPVPGDGEVLREAGLDPVGWRECRRIVFVSPHVHGVVGSVADRGSVVAANRSLALARAAVAAPRRAALIFERPLEVDLAAVVPHGPFASAAAGSTLVHAQPSGFDASRALAESLIAADAEAVFDMRAAFSAPAVVPAEQRSFESLPAQRLDLVHGLPAPLVVRSRTVAGATWVHVVNAAPEPGSAVLTLGGRPSLVIDAVDRSALTLDETGGVSVPLGPWGVRTLIIDGGVAVRAARMDYDERVRRRVLARMERLLLRRAALEAPVALDVLDNPGFELGPAASAGRRDAAVAGWEVVESRRGAVAAVPGMPGTDGAVRALEFVSFNGLSTLRSNPFPAPRTGRVSVAAWLRIKEGDAQPPLRVALEGVQEEREYYRFASVGGLSGGRPLGPEWSQFVLQVDDLPATGLESLRVRFDLLGPGSVQIDDVRVFDLAFDESQRAQLTKVVSLLEHGARQGDLGSCIAGLDGHWPAFLEAFVPDSALSEAPAPEPRAARTDPAPVPASGGMLDRVKGWWR